MIIDNNMITVTMQGHICGLDAMAGRPHLLMFDISQCLSPGVLLSGCATPQVRNLNIDIFYRWFFKNYSSVLLF